MQKIPPSFKSYINRRFETGRDIFKVPISLDIAGFLMSFGRPLWQALGNFESIYWEKKLSRYQIEKPVYICGLARSGSTILLETLYRTDQFASHLYRDYPFIDIPILWNRWINLLPASSEGARERAHLDGLKVTVHSPEALEEMIWMNYFPDCHDMLKYNVIDEKTDNIGFQSFYANHIKKILGIHHKERYLAKGNYNLTRISYLKKLFPDLRIIIPIRDPISHVASLVKQQMLFSTFEKKNKRATRYLHRIGHFEFGVGRRPINSGNNEYLAQIIAAWSDGDEIRGWALYYDMLHKWLLKILISNENLRKSILLVSYSSLCQTPEQELRRIFEFCSVQNIDQYIVELSQVFKEPSYYRTDFDKTMINEIEYLTVETYDALINLI